MSDKKCLGVMGWLFGHSFHALYDEAPTLTSVTGVDEVWMEDVIRASMKRTFRCAVCNRCGLTVPSEPQ